MSLTTAPVELYTDPEVFGRERSVVFAASWLFLGLEADLVRPGDYLADAPADFPVVVVRDAAGQLRGFHNVCRHRAGPLVGEGKGRCDREFVCRYHAWRYGFDGRLIAAGDFPPPPNASASPYDLFPIRVETWRGLVFVNLDLDAAPLADTLGPLDRLFGAHKTPPARVRHSHTIASNWKVYVENLLDGYHLEGVHPVLAAKAGDQRHDISIEGQVAVANPHGEEQGFWAWVWPNLGFHFHRGVLLIEQVLPESPTRMRSEHMYLHEPEDPGVDAAMTTAERIFDEDAWVCERVQRNLAAGVFREGVASPAHDGAVAWFQARVDQALAR
ncbi:MAG: aromatic ring-hydroxylating dioxygenase subunit alpha [Caulobacteraceae bacterium]